MLDVYLARAVGKQPLVVFVQGSRSIPLFEYGYGQGIVRSALPFELRNLLDARVRNFHLALLERRGLRSFGEAVPGGDENPRATKERGGISKHDRVDDVGAAVAALKAEPWAGEVFLVGHSEGADVAAGVVKLLGEQIGAVALLAGAGPSQLYDFVAAARRRQDSEAVRQVFDEILWLTSPAAAADYRGLPRERWVSFALESTPLDDLRDSSVPVFVAHGTHDDAASIEGAELFVVELLRQNAQRPIFYLMLPGLDHRYISADDRSHFAEVVSVFLDWAFDPAKRRHVQVGSPVTRGAVTGRETSR
jgi:pimeloyl-ACP methyl ester carboxylesterase